MRLLTAVVVVVATVAATVTDAHSSASNAIFGVGQRRTASLLQLPKKKNTNSALLTNSIITNTPRGGADLIGEVDEEQEQQLYLPGLLEAIVPSKSSVNTAQQQPTASTDYTLQISSSKAKELNVSNGSLVAVIGRRRRASYGKVQVTKLSSGKVKMSSNLASNLRVMDTDTVKIIPLSDDTENNESEAYTLGTPPTNNAAYSVTFAPIKDALHNLELKERGGDEYTDEELVERFVAPYLNLDDDGDGEESGGVILKEGHVVVLKDDNGVGLEFMISHLDLIGEDDSDADEEVQKGKLISLVLVFACHTYFPFNDNIST